MENTHQNQSSEQNDKTPNNRDLAIVGPTMPPPPPPSKIEQELVKPSLKRFVILILFCLTTGNKSFQWIQVPASTMKATVFYGVDNYMINLSSILFMFAFMVVSWPACYLIGRVGVRKAVLLGSLGTVLGSAIKAYSCYESSVAMLLFGQVIIALSQQLVHQIPPRIASVWFPDDEVSSCVAICLFGNQIGVALGFLIPQWLMRDSFTRDEIGSSFFKLFLITLIYSTVLLIANWILFDEAPAHAPGLARQRQMAIEQQSRDTNATDGSVAHLWQQIKELFKNRDFVLMSLVSGLSYGRSDTMATLLDQTIKPLYPNNATLVGNVGFLVITAGALGTPAWGWLLDKTRAYKTINLATAICISFALMLFVYALLFLKLEWAIYAVACLFGFFQTGLLVSSMAFAIELTYPAPEMITSSIMFIMPAILGPLFVIIGSHVVDTYGAFAANMFYLSTVIASLVCILFCRERLRRQEAIVLQGKEQQAVKEAQSA